MTAPHFIATLPSAHAAAALLLTIATFALFASGRMRAELICLLVVAVIAVGFYVFPLESEGRYTGFQVAFGGFGHEALVAICCLMILGRGLVVTGALEPAARLLGRLWRFNGALGLFCMLTVCMGVSGFVNDTPVLVLALPIVLDLAQRVGLSASRTLMPVNAAILIGGMATTIGTSTNVLVVSLARDLGVPEIGLFEFTDIVAIAALVAFPYVWLVMPRLLPLRIPAGGDQHRRFRATLHVVDGATVLARHAGALSTLLPAEVRLLALMRGTMPVGPNPLEVGDVLHVEASAPQLREVSELLRTPLALDNPGRALGAATANKVHDMRLAQLAIGGDCMLVGKSVAEASATELHGVHIVGTFRATDRRPAYALSRPAEERLEVGDLILVRGTEPQLRDFERSTGVMQLAGAHELPRTAKAPIALAIVAAVVVVAAFKILPIAIAALAGAIAMLATGAVKYENIGRALSVEVIVLVAASIALGRTLVETGAADWLAALMASGLHSAPPAVVLSAMMLFCAVLTNFVSNAAAAAIGTPLAVSLAGALSIQSQPLVLAVLFGCNLCYVTPMAYQTNLLIMGAAGYSFRDFARAGSPLAAIMIATLAWLLVRRYGL